MVQGIIITDGHIVDRNPATGEILGYVPMASKREVSQVVENAREAQVKWAQLSLADRIEKLKSGCRLLPVQEIAALVTAEMGKPLSEAMAEAEGASDKDAYLDLVGEANLEEYTQGEKDLIVRDPLGLVAVLSPWNFPCDEILLLALPALAAGNAVIVKPSEVTPLAGAKTVKTLASVLPPNTLQIVQGDGRVGQWLVESPDVNMVAMTGSTKVGKQIMSKCANTLKRLVLELGGKDPMVVFKDADLHRAASDAVKYSLSNTGQVCSSIERIYIEESSKDIFEAKVVEAAKMYLVGNGRDKPANVGPLVTEMQRENVKAQVKKAIEEGASLLYQSKIPEPQPEGSSFFPITVLGNLSQNMDMQHTETFGPVVALSTFNGSEDEAVRLANDTEYGLTSCVYTRDIAKAQRVAQRIRAGQVGINCYAMKEASASCPWVGHKSSGFGYHSGRDGWRQFSVPKSIIIPSNRGNNYSGGGSTSVLKVLRRLSWNFPVGIVVGGLATAIAFSINNGPRDKVEWIG